MSLLLNALQATSVRLFTPWKGVPFADVDLPLADVGGMPFGPCTMQLGDTGAYRGMIDPRNTGEFATTGKARVLVGGGGWHKPVPAQHFHGVVLSTAVYNATGAIVGEVVADLLPRPLGVDFVRMQGRASSVLDGVDWYVRPDGTTVVGPRLPLPLDPNATIVSWDPLTNIAEIDSNDPIQPGTLLVDPLRFPTTLTVRDVEQVWTASGARATCWCGDAPTRGIGKALGAFVDARLALLKKYQYRVVVEDPVLETLVLQAVDPLAGAPNMIPLSMWPGMSGVSAQLTPGSMVLVEFIAGDRTLPVVTSFANGKPIILELDASTLVKIGLGTLGPVAMAPGVLAMIAALQIEIAAIQGVLTTISVPGSIFLNTAMADNSGAAFQSATAVGATAVTACVEALAAAAPEAQSLKLVSE